jgi:tRNA (cmo5U34)-methyltransferase
MRNDEIKALFDQQAEGYDTQWARLAPMRDALHFLLESVFAELPTDARILCIGAGTGAEMAYLARKFPGWSFTAVEPSGAMLNVCRDRAKSERFAERCYFHEGYVDSLPGTDLYDASTCFLVSQFILDQNARADLFRSIAGRLRPEAILASSDLASNTGSDEYKELLHVWANIMSAADLTPERLQQMQRAYENDVAVLPPTTIASIIESGGFETPVQFFQAGLIHAWFSKRICSGL